MLQSALLNILDEKNTFLITCFFSCLSLVICQMDHAIKNKLNNGREYLRKKSNIYIPLSILLKL